jgi:hypothetical protein
MCASLLPNNPESKDPIPYFSYWRDCDKIKPFALQDSQVFAAQKLAIKFYVPYQFIGKNGPMGIHVSLN